MQTHWRTLLRVIAIEVNHIWCVAPVWDAKLAFPVIPQNFIPFKTKPYPGMRFHAELMLGAIHAVDLTPRNFEESESQMVPTVAELTGDGDPTFERAIESIDSFIKFRDDHGLDEDMAKVKAGLHMMEKVSSGD